MERIADKIRHILLAVTIIMGTVFVVAPASAQTEGDSVEISLLTCTPNQKIYGLYGHTALRLHDLRTGADWAFNYGVFNFKTSFFALRFLFGLTDYELAVMPMAYFREEYTRMKCQVTEQVLNLNAEEKRRMVDALDENYLPQNRTYRYNYFYDNCTTRARDMIERNIDGKIAYGDATADGVSYRDMIHAHTTLHPWAALGNDLCLGFKADKATTWRERQFLPENLMHDLGRAKIVGRDGKERPAVASTRMIVDGGVQTTESEFPLSPTQCAALLLALTVAVTAIEAKRRKALRLFDAALMAVQGLCGLIITALLFSEHPTTSTNLQILLLNPVPLAFAYSVARGRGRVWWKVETALIIAFLAGGFAQNYAEGMEIVALSLLLRCVMHLFGSRRLHIKE